MISGITGGSAGAITPPKQHQRRFSKMDKNGDGGLDESELAGMAKRTGKDASQLLTELDANKDGKVDAGEMQAAMAKRRAQGAQGGQPGQADPTKDAASQFTTSLMNILKQLQGSDKNSDSDSFAKMDTDGDGKLSQAEFTAGMAKQKETSDQDLNASASEFTSSLMNLFKQLHGQDDGSQEASAGAQGQDGHCDPVTTADGGTQNTSGSQDLLAQFKAAIQGGFSFSQTTTTEMTTLQAIA
jgi:Ca2+-binding EF-hand superfamily protein